jgi:hypothetical protein
MQIVTQYQSCNSQGPKRDGSDLVKQVLQGRSNLYIAIPESSDQPGVAGAHPGIDTPDGADRSVARDVATRLIPHLKQGRTRGDHGE